MSVPVSLPLTTQDAKDLVADATASHIQLDEPIGAGTGLLYGTGRSLDPNKGSSVCVIGAFDGVHKGHRTLLTRAATDARRRAAQCVAVTFDPDPMDVIAPGTPSTRLLSCPDRFAQLAAACPGIQGILAFPFTDELRNTSCEDFCLGVLAAAVDIASIHVGVDFHMGLDRGGDLDQMTQIGLKHGFDVYGERLVDSGGERISATRIRRLLRDGRLNEAHMLLGRCHFVRGRVEHGRGAGTTFGFPTANVRCNIRDCLPKAGVYACYALIGKCCWPAAVNVGAPPTFSGETTFGGQTILSEESSAFLEAHLIGFSGDMYDTEITIVFVRHIRPSRRFDSVDELRELVLANIAWVRQNLGTGKIELAS